jgi:hypothetical protein
MPRKELRTRRPVHNPDDDTLRHLLPLQPGKGKLTAPFHPPVRLITAGARTHGLVLRGAEMLTNQEFVKFTQNPP